MWSYLAIRVCVGSYLICSRSKSLTITPEEEKKQTNQQLVQLYQSLQEVITSRSTGFCAVFITGKLIAKKTPCVCLAGGATLPSPLTPATPWPPVSETTARNKSQKSSPIHCNSEEKMQIYVSIFTHVWNKYRENFIWRWKHTYMGEKKVPHSLRTPDPNP